MKRIPPMDEDSRFRAQVRHYHRADTRRESTWHDWVDGGLPPRRRLMVRAGIVAATLLVIAVVVGGLFHYVAR